MEYTFKNSPDEPLTQVELSATQLIIREADKERIIPFSTITDLRLHRKKDFFFMEIHSLHFGSIRIGNRWYNATGEWDDQSGKYQGFVRILHFHLIKNQCQANFCAGLVPSSILEKYISLILLSILVYTVSDYTNNLPYPPLIVAGLVFVIGAILLVTPYLLNKTKTYPPSDIPLNMLPPAN
jgi:hypothetical protein